MAAKKSPKGKKEGANRGKGKGKKAKSRKIPSGSIRKTKKEAMEMQVEGIKAVDKKVVEWRKSLMAPAERAMIDFFLYPVAKNRLEKEAAKRVMVESYEKGDEVVKQFILFLSHEQLSRAAGIRIMHNFAHFKKMFPKETAPGEVRKAVYRTIFNYTTSIEGITELIGFLGQLGDIGAAKLLSYHLSYYSGAEAPVLQVFRNATIDALGECKTPYALEALLSYAKYSEKNERALYALKAWEKKIDGMKMEKEEKKFYSREIGKLFASGKEKHEYYR